MRLVGFDELPSRGITQGNIVDLAEASGVVENLMSRLKEKYELALFKTVAAIGGIGFFSDRAKATIALPDGPRELVRRDIERLVQIARNMSFSFERSILHEIVEDYVLDGQEGVRHPKGLFARKVEAKLYTLFQNTAHVQNAIRCINYAGYDVEKVVFSGFVSTSAVLTGDELKDGIIVVDIGAQTTKITVAQGNEVIFCNLLPVGGADITKSIAARCKIPFPVAEDIKHDTEIMHDAEPSGSRTVLAAGKEREIPQSVIHKSIVTKTDEILTMIRRELEGASVLDNVRSGMVITGGGAFLEGLLERAERCFQMPVRFGKVGESCQDTRRPLHTFAPSIGALAYYARHIEHNNRATALKAPFRRLADRVTTFLNDYF
jgi:cell division protein FtsA